MASAEKKKKSVDLKKQLSECLKEKQDYLEGWQRERAEFVNYKRSESERINRSVRQENRKVLLDVLAVLDDMERLTAEAGKRYQLDDPFFQGIDKIMRGFMDFLEKRGVERIATEGQEFDPEQHEAFEIVTDDAFQEGEIVSEISAGYMLEGEVLRPARVRVAGSHSSN